MILDKLLAFTPSAQAITVTAPSTDVIDLARTRAVLDGVKPSALSEVPDAGPKPPWLRVRLPTGAKYQDVMEIVQSHRLSTVCAESKCPNIAECWGRGTATLMLMGSVCTRACKFCSVNTGNPKGWLDPQEPANVANAVALMDLRYVVLTSVDRDDLPDLGAGHYAACIRAIHDRMPDTAVEALTPDFQGRHELVAQVLATPGRRVTAYSDPARALAALQHEGADLLIADLRIPGFDHVWVEHPDSAPDEVADSVVRSLLKNRREAAVGFVLVIMRT